MNHSRAFLASAGLAALLALASPLRAEVAATRGPHGESATPAKSLTLTPEQEAKVKAGGFTAALVWHTSSDYTTAVNQGAKDEFARLGIAVVAQTDAGFDAAKQKSDVETVMAKKPSAILSLPVDPETAPEAYKPARDAGVTLVFVDNSPKGYEQGKDYVAVVSDDLSQMGKRAGDAMGAALNGKGKIGYVFHDADFYVTNQRDRGFKQTILDSYKGIEIVAEQGLADPTRAEDIANALVAKHPDLDGIYVTWAEPAESVLAALRNAGNTHTRIVTLDLSEPLALDMVKGGNVAAIVADEAYQIGVTAARAAAAGLIGEKTAPFYAVDAIAVTKANLKDGWNRSLHRDPPPTLAAP
ncbi:substrate-binding domain-containing protein [Labrys wisconsinensis]|uniref:Ribose transport system substrate-binding protein n=1 Tax=Labrys wisconsinensis TaxID=425677 RepID=A0ABU0JB63_9HYPH|nr:substrate-binding domain-containing protein [Labrys wisconsinensis]MDQ0471522.1 ribose transport system substrate-binding protein [Labrys wisconsinensis]